MAADSLRKRDVCAFRYNSTVCFRGGVYDARPSISITTSQGGLYDEKVCMHGLWICV